MAFSKSNHYPPNLQLISFYAKALAHPARITILEQLLSKGPMPVELIAKNHPISQPALSGHLKALRKAKFVNYKENFPNTLYRVDIDHVNLAQQHIGEFLKKF